MLQTLATEESRDDAISAARAAGNGMKSSKREASATRAKEATS